jgi:hypothetical protein
MWIVVYENELGKSVITQAETFADANALAKSIRQFSRKVRLKKVGEPARRWDVYLHHDPHSAEIVASQLTTRAAMLTWLKWDHRGHGAVLVLWPNDVPRPVIASAIAS